MHQELHTSRDVLPDPASPRSNASRAPSPSASFHTLILHTTSYQGTISMFKMSKSSPIHAFGLSTKWQELLTGSKWRVASRAKRAVTRRQPPCWWSKAAACTSFRAQPLRPVGQWPEAWLQRTNNQWSATNVKLGAYPWRSAERQCSLVLTDSLVVKGRS